MNKKDYKNMWVYIEHDGSSVHSVGLELCSEIRQLCDISGDRLFAVIVGSLPDAEISRVEGCGVDGIIRVTGENCETYNTDVYANIFTVLSKKYKPSAIFVGGTINGRDFAPRFSVQLNTGCTSDAMELAYDRDSGDIRFIEPAVGGKIMAVITVPVLRPQVGTIRPGTFKYAPVGRKDDIELINETIDFPAEKLRCRSISFTPDEFDPAFDIANADTIVCLGNGLAGEEELPRYRELASLLGAKLACTRPLFDREIFPYKLQVGQSGVMIKPKLYISFGVSGAVNHVAGVDAEFFVAVNKDANAQIFNYCDLGIVGDMNEVCDTMIARLRARL